MCGMFFKFLYIDFLLDKKNINKPHSFSQKIYLVRKIFMWRLCVCVYMNVCGGSVYTVYVFQFFARSLHITSSVNRECFKYQYACNTDKTFL